MKYSYSIYNQNPQICEEAISSHSNIEIEDVRNNEEAIEIAVDYFEEEVSLMENERLYLVVFEDGFEIFSTSEVSVK